MPRKTSSFHLHALLDDRASMRPRPDAAENGFRRGSAGAASRFNEAAARCRGKRRRRRRTPRPRSRFNEAAARCRGKQTARSVGLVASACFNEAAARCRGKHARDGLVVSALTLASMRPRPDAAENPDAAGRTPPPRPASMRPRPDAAENESGCHSRGAARRRFNEAAARCRGKRTPAGTTGCASTRFNEAAARCRGKHEVTTWRETELTRASMRPRPDAAENLEAQRDARLGVTLQ